MRQHLNVLLDARTRVETQILHDRIREIRSEANMNHVFGSSMQVNITLRACSDYIDNYFRGALDDYKRVVSVDPERFNRNYLKDLESDFVTRMEREVKIVRDLVERAVGGMIEYHGDPLGNWMQNYDRPSSLALKRIASEVTLFNMHLLDLKPKLSTRIKDWCDDKPPLVLFGYALAGAAAVATIKGTYDIVAGLID